MWFFTSNHGGRARRQEEGAWETPESEKVIRVTGIQLATKYIDCQQAMVAHWVALRPLLDIFAQETT